MSEKARSHHKPTFLEETRSPLVRLCHRAIFGLLMLVIVAAPLIAGRSRPWAEQLLMFAVALAGCFWILRVLVVREAQVVFSQLGAPFLILATYALMRYSLAEVEPVARPDMLLAVSGTLVFFLVLNDVRHRWQITLLVWTLTGLGVLLTLLAMWQVVRGGRPTATFARPADFAAYLLLVLPVVAANFFFSRRSLPEKVGFALAGFLMCGGFVITQTYWHWLGWLAAFLLVAIFVIQKRGWRFRWLAIGGFLLGAVLLITVISNFAVRHSVAGAASNSEDEMPPVSLNLARLAELHDITPSVVRPSFRNPTPLWKTVLMIGRRNLWLGSGPGMVEWLYPAERSVQARVRRAGNEYCNVFAETGLLGCALLIWVVVAFGVAVVQILNLRAGRYSVGQQSNRFAFAIAGLAVIAAVIVNAGVDLNLRVAGNTYTLLAIMGAVMTCGVHRRADEDNPVHQPGRYTTMRMRGASRFVLAAGLGVLLVLLATRLSKSFPSTWLLRTGNRALQQLDWPAAESAYLRAWKFDPRSFEVAAALGDLNAARATWNARQRDQLGTHAISWYRRARAINPYAYDLLIRIARLNDLLGQRDDALNAYKEAVQNDPLNASYHAQLGLHYQRWGEDDLAQKSFRVARQFGASELLPVTESAKADSSGT